MSARTYVGTIVFVAMLCPVTTHPAEARQADSDFALRLASDSRPAAAELRFLMLYGSPADQPAASIRTLCKESSRQAIVCGSAMFAGGFAAATWGLWKLDFLSFWTRYQGPPGIYVTAGITLGGFIFAVWGLHLIRYGLGFPRERFGP